MLPITRANLQNFCRVCLRDISDEKGEREVTQTKMFLPNKMCSNCDVKLCALRKFRCKAIIATGVLRIIVNEEKLKSKDEMTSNGLLTKLQSICRICLKDQKLKGYSARVENHANDIFECTGLNIFESSEESRDVLKDDPNFPDWFCNKCHTTLRSFIEFRTISKQTADYLKNVFDELGNEHETRNETNVEQEAPVLPNTNYEHNTEQLLVDALEFVEPAVVQSNQASPRRNNVHAAALQVIETNAEFTQKDYLSENSDNEHLYFDNKTSSDNELESNDFDFTAANQTACSNTETVNSTSTKISKDHNSFITTQNLAQVAVKDLNLDNNVPKTKKQRAPKTFQKTFKCIECNKSFYKKFMYEAHIKSVHENIEKPFSCPHCQTSFRLVQVLHRHISCCHANNSNNGAEFNVPRKPSHICLLCQSIFKRREHLKEHVRAVHEKLRPFKCGICGKAFGTRNTQMRHEKNHSISRPFSCEYCAKRYNSESELKVHIQRHTANPALLCPICKRAKKTIEELQAHVAMHKSSYQCTTCGKIFKKMFHLREHESTVHLKLRSLKCSFCELTFTIRKTLKNHEKSHDAIGRPEKCSLCELNFKSKRALALHTKKVHLKES